MSIKLVIKNDHPFRMILVTIYFRFLFPYTLLRALSTTTGSFNALAKFRYPVYACPIVTNDPEYMIACVTDVIVAQNSTDSETVYTFFLLSKSKEDSRYTGLILKHVTDKGIMEPEQALMYTDLISDMFPDRVSWLFNSPIPVLEGQRNHELE